MNRCPQCDEKILKPDQYGRMTPLPNYTMTYLVFYKKEQLLGPGGVPIFENVEQQVPKYKTIEHRVGIACCKTCAENLDHDLVFDKKIQHTPQGKRMKTHGFRLQCSEKLQRKVVKKAEGRV